MRKLSHLFMALALAALAGCSFFEVHPYKPVCYFDLGVPDESMRWDLRVRVRHFNTDGPYRDRMVYRNSSHQVEFDPYNRWAQFPHKLLRNYFILLFNDSPEDNGSDKQSTVVMDAALLRFEADLRDRNVSMTMDIRLHDQKSGDLLWSEIYHKRAEMADLTASSYAQAMGVAVGEFAEQVKDKLLEMEAQGLIKVKR